MKTKKIVLSAFIIIAICFITTIQSTAAANFEYELLQPIFTNETSSDLPTYIGYIYKFFIWAVGIAALLMISIGGFMYVTSAGNQANADTAKRIIRDALFGLTAVLLAWLILYLINPDLVNINLRSITEVGPK